MEQFGKKVTIRASFSLASRKLNEEGFFTGIVSDSCYIVSID